MKKIGKKIIICLFIIMTLFMISCTNTKTDNSTNNDENVVIDKVANGVYNTNALLVKCKENIILSCNVLQNIEYKSFEALYNGSRWYKVIFDEDVKLEDAIVNLMNLKCFDDFDYDYIMGSDGEEVYNDVENNPKYSEQSYFDLHNIDEVWNYNKENNLSHGGSSDVVVAVIDTGVDYNHLDLRNNIWVNPLEIPNNNIDDDNNGYVDDINGWNCVGDNNNPMDDNGHGTHVAGIIAAENNNIGSVGVAFNTKIMVLKAGNSSGYFNNSDIAEAIQYAYMNGASVINMSFGGTSISLAVEEALENAYNQCILVAAAGNDSICNQPFCDLHDVTSASYPAALPYVIGVMSCNENGTMISNFSNYDHISFNSVEYEVAACGEEIYSTWPNNKYNTLNGTSMAAPVVAGVAALLRSTYTDRNQYSTKFIQSQIVNNGQNVSFEYDDEIISTGHNSINAYDSLTKFPTPSVNLYDYYIFDNVEYSSKNNANGKIDAGETIRIGIELQNKGGVANNVKAVIDTIRNNDESITDPYITITKNAIEMSDIGTYSVRNSGLIYDENDLVVGVNNYFEIIVSDDCPNEYLSDINLNFTYNNGLDETDTTAYSGSGTLKSYVSHGVILPLTVTEDTVYPGNKLYIIERDFNIAEGVTVTFEAGAKIQFYSYDEGYYNTLTKLPKVNIYGELYFNGADNNYVEIYCNEYINSKGLINILQEGKFISNYSLFKNIRLDTWHDDNKSFTGIYNSQIINERADIYLNYWNSRGEIDNCRFEMYDMSVSCSNVTNSTLILKSPVSFAPDNIENNIIYMLQGSSNSGIRIRYNCKNNAFVQEYNSRLAKDYAKINNVYKPLYEGNKFYGLYEIYPETMIDDYITSSGEPMFDINDKNGQDLSLLPPYMMDIEITNQAGEVVKTVGTEEVTFTVKFNRSMNIEDEFNLYFGSIEPFKDYKISGSFIDDKTWVGKYKVTSKIENGTQRFSATSISTSDNNSIKLLDNGKMFTFDIDTTAALSMNLQAESSDKGVNLSWIQDDYETLMGYNVYRSDEKDGKYVKLNQSIIAPGDNTFIDENAEPGKTYWYTFTVVLSDFSESKPAGKVSASIKDTILPNVYHTPVNQGYLNNNLVISCNAKDNVGITKVSLFYRTVGTTSWNNITMVKQNDKYSATLFGSELSLEGLEYYIVAYDKNNAIYKGTETNPYKVIIKDATSISKYGDVDGDGEISTKDALMIIKALNGEIILTDDQFTRADLNKDELLSSVEALRILQFINGNVNSLEMN